MFKAYFLLTNDREVSAAGERKLVSLVQHNTLLVVHVIKAYFFLVFSDLGTG